MKGFFQFMFDKFKSKMTTQKILVFYSFLITFVSYIPFVNKRSFGDNLTAITLNFLYFIPMISFYSCNFINDINKLKKVMEVPNKKEPIKLLTKEKKAYTRIIFVGVTMTMITNQILITYNFNNSFQAYITLLIGITMVWITTFLHSYYGQYVIECERIKIETLKKFSQNDDYEDAENLHNIF